MPKRPTSRVKLVHPVRPVYRGPMPPGTTSRLVSKALAVCLMLALAVFPTSCASTESTPVRTPTPDNPWPDSTRARVQECVEQGVSDLPEGHNSVQFDLFVTPDGLVQEVRAKGETLAAHDVQICINQALKAMTVPAFVLERAASASNKQPVMMPSRELMGDVTVATMEGILAGLEPMLVEAGPVGVAVIVGIFVLAAVVGFAGKWSKSCQKEQQSAVDRCLNLLQLKYPSRNFTGGHTDVVACAKGFVSQPCGGNAVDYGPSARPGRRN